MNRIDSIPSNIHDGYLRFVSVHKKIFTCIIDRLDGSELEIQAEGVEKLCVNNFYDGNVVLDARVLLASNAVAGDIRSFFDENIVPNPAALLSTLEAQNGALLLIDASYGAVVGLAFNGDLSVKA